MISLNKLETILTPLEEQPPLKSRDQRMAGRCVMIHTCRAYQEPGRGKKCKDQNNRLFLKYHDPESNQSVRITVGKGWAKLFFDTDTPEQRCVYVQAFDGGLQSTTLAEFYLPQNTDEGVVTKSRIEEMNFKQTAALGWILEHAVLDVERLRESQKRYRLAKKEASKHLA